MTEDKEYYIATKEEDGYSDLIYESALFKFSEWDLITLIRLCFAERRHLGLGTKLISIYRDSTKHRIKITNDRLNNIGVKIDEQPKPTKTTKAEHK